MMNTFIEKWKNDKKYQAKIKLLIYGLFIISVLLFVNLSSSGVTSFSNETNKDNTLINRSNNNVQDVIELPENYEYSINITIDDNNYQYSGIKKYNEKTIKKNNNNIITNYIYKNNDYFIEANDNYIITTKEEVYDVINYNYINIDNINMYLNKGTKNGSQYLVFLKDIVLGNDTDTYFVIQVNNKQINIDYTPLMKEFNPELKTYKVEIIINEIE